jgi:hypothetical protein
MANAYFFDVLNNIRKLSEATHCFELAYRNGDFWLVVRISIKTREVLVKFGCSCLVWVSLNGKRLANREHLYERNSVFSIGTNRAGRTDYL